jgi:predicted SAM-dependent methyltransferase
MNRDKHLSLLVTQKDGTKIDEFRSKGIEIGPFYNPVVPKSEGWNTTTVDILSKEELLDPIDRKIRETYRKRTEDVDIIWDWKNKSLDEEVINKIGGNLDYVISSHSIEHVVDLLGFIKSCSNILKPEGVFNLAIPDLRFTFDFFRNPSSLGQVLSVHNNKLKRHSSEVYLDAIVNQAHALVKVKAEDIHDEYDPYPIVPTGSTGLCAWVKSTKFYALEKVILLNQKFEDSWKMYQDDLLSEKHMDFHNWVFTPTSFKLLIFDLYTLGIIDFQVNKMVQDDSTIGSEFFVQLVKKDKTSKNITSEEIYEYRSKLLCNIVIELAERVAIGKLKKEDV